ncbi:MAG: hypothetical protein N4A33_04850 [Bacteriovoracaceae bacterium]|jgi:hypothetical protein|nr:hypothetical protein [Bacteriovoracaceae bacterium]
MQLYILGLASGTKKKISLSSNDLEKSLLFFLLKEKKIPLASSCNGHKVCKKCVFNEKLLMCNFTVKDFLDREIKISYL